MFEKALIFCFISFAIAMLAVAFAALEDPFVDIIEWYKNRKDEK